MKCSLEKSMFLSVYLQKASDPSSLVTQQPCACLQAWGRAFLPWAYAFGCFCFEPLLRAPPFCPPIVKHVFFLCPQDSRHCTWWWLVSSLSPPFSPCCFPPSPTEEISHYTVSFRAAHSGGNTLLLLTQNQAWACHNRRRASHYLYTFHCSFPVPPTDHPGSAHGYICIPSKRKLISRVTGRRETLWSWLVTGEAVLPCMVRLLAETWLKNVDTFTLLLQTPFRHRGCHFWNPDLAIKEHYPFKEKSLMNANWH